MFSWASVIWQLDLVILTHSVHCRLDTRRQYQTSGKDRGEKTQEREDTKERPKGKVKQPRQKSKGKKRWLESLISAGWKDEKK